MKDVLTPAAILAKGVRLFASFTKPDSIYATPLFRRRLRHWHDNIGRDVFIELMPTLVLRVRDPKTGEILAQSKPGKIDQLDESAPVEVETVWGNWVRTRRAVFTDDAAPVPGDKNTPEACEP